MKARMAFPAALALLLTGCGATEYHGHDSGIDEILWSQAAAFKAPFDESTYRAQVNQPEAYLAALPGTRWDGRAGSAQELGLDDGGLVLHDIASTASSTKVSVFIASGPRTADAAPYFGPSEIYTCYRIDTTFARYGMPSAGRTDFEGCPEALVAQLSENAAFAGAEVFDG